jgi:hypothetical protein
MVTRMNSPEITALLKAVSSAEAKAASAALTPGSHEVDFTVRIQGTFNRAEDHPTTLVQKAKPWSLLALAMSKLNGVTVEALVTEFFDQDPGKTKDIEDRAKAAIKKIKGSTAGMANGSVTSVKLEVTQMGVDLDATVESKEVA